MPTSADELRKIGKLIEAAAGEGLGFALFLVTGGTTSYTSNGNRTDMMEVMEEWLHKTSPATITVDLRGHGLAGRSFAANPKKETSHEVDTRLGLEARCSQIGQRISDASDLVLFLFNYGDHGNMAYWTNSPHAHAAVTAWVKAARARS